jgi:hypothetical protein
MARWNYEAMGQAGLTGIKGRAARPIASSLAQRTGRSDGQILALIGAALLVITLIGFLRTVRTVIAAGRTPQVGQ